MSSPTEILRRHDRRPVKALGQCFLHDPAVVQRIVQATGATAADTVIEIGAGLGILTRALADRVAHVVAIECDRNLIGILGEELAAVRQAKIVEGDALALSFAELSPGVPRDKLKVAGNLPYNISSPLLFHILEQRHVIASATVMLQKEVAQRICAEPGTKTYGAPSVMCQQYADLHWCFAVGRGAFTPAPRVDSAVVHLKLRTTPRAATDEKTFRRVVRTAFGKRRKTLKRALQGEFTPAAIEQALAHCQLDGRRRGETLTVTEFAHLARALT